MSKNATLIKDLIIFYITENYNKYLEEKGVKSIPENRLYSVVSELYDEKKGHLQQFLKDSLQKIMKDDYIGDGAVSTICLDIFEDDEYCKRRLVLEIKKQQGESS